MFGRKCKFSNRDKAAICVNPCVKTFDSAIRKIKIISSKYSRKEFQ
ncbi:hypothetical protein NEIELOOT_02877 [Neisseria elongata subsp. glycolytica ATCC 29315]|uniref:Uncharacterized protein n=1 Tax=Neisseria elongata subsp. glycolytica ATCC 29315 TaxID=546263 RepID=D4DUW4_NEIEG|nr:hypothetical protein NEIELOOT_02877 [Neisseria elongata subsp. glycolytica ATCC 29315]